MNRLDLEMVGNTWNTPHDYQQCCSVPPISPNKGTKLQRSRHSRGSCNMSISIFVRQQKFHSIVLTWLVLNPRPMAMFLLFSRKWNHLECSTKLSSLSTGRWFIILDPRLAFGWTHHSNTKDKALQVILAARNRGKKRTVVQRSRRPSGRSQTSLH